MKRNAVRVAMVASGVSIAVGLVALAIVHRNEPVRQASPIAIATPKPPVEEKVLLGEYYFGDGLGVNCHLILTAKQ